MNRPRDKRPHQLFGTTRSGQAAVAELACIAAVSSWLPAFGDDFAVLGVDEYRLQPPCTGSGSNGAGQTLTVRS